MLRIVRSNRAVIFLSAALCAVSLLAAMLPFEPEETTSVLPGQGEIYSGIPGMGATSIPRPMKQESTKAAVQKQKMRLCRGWPVFLDAPGAGFPYTPTLFDADHDGADEIFLTGGHTFALKGDGSFLPGWPTGEMTYMGYGTNACKPGPSAADLDGDGDTEVLWSERDWYAGSSHMWCFNAKNLDGSDLPGFPHTAPDQSSNALDTPFVLGDTDHDGDLEAWGAHSLGNTFTHYRVTAYDHLGNRLFTQDLNPAENILSLYFGDLDHNGSKEVFAVSWLDPAFYLHTFDADGNEQPGFPVTLFTMPSGGYQIFGPPIPADLDQDGDLEILHGYNRNGTSYARCYHHDGTAFTGFPIQVATSSQLFYLGLGDLTGDGFPELLALDNHLGSDYRAHAIDMETGLHLPGWPYALPNWPKGFPAVVDVDDDGVQDMCLVTDGGEIYALSGDGQLISGFPKAMASASISGVAAGDIDRDGLYELVAATWDGWVYAWDTPSHVLPGRADWPMRGINARNTGVFGDVPVKALSADAGTISETFGGTVNFSLHAGAENSMRNYLLLASASGTAPGFPLPGGQATLPLNWDPMSDVVLALLNTPFFSDFLGAIDGSGQATAQMNVRPLPTGSSGETLHFAFCLNGPFDFVSNTVEVEIVR
ncbi:MAG: VCBS repeat-containing protein [Planctomycetota bacterium]